MRAIRRAAAERQIDSDLVRERRVMLNLAAEGM
jgi:hypothetical protein